MTRNMIKILLGIIIILGICIIGTNIYNKYFYEAKVIEMDNNDTKNIETVKQQINAHSNIRVDTNQAKQIVNQIENIEQTNKKPVTTITTTGKDYKKVSTDYTNKYKFDTSILTTADKNKNIKDIKETDSVVLNQYNIKAYPDQMIGISAYSDGEKEIEYTKRIKIFKENVYVGPAIKFDNNGKVAGGIKINIPL